MKTFTQEEMLKLNIALTWACIYHSNQFDKGGQPYIYHVLRVGLRGQNFKEQVVGFLHDLVEDTECTLEMICNSFGLVIGKAVDAITMRQGETRQEYIERCVEDDIARQVKKYDLNDNGDPERMARLDAGTRERMDKKHRQYWDAIARKEEAIWNGKHSSSSSKG